VAVMFATEDVCCVSQETLKAEGFGDTLPKVLRARGGLRVEAGGHAQGGVGGQDTRPRLPPATVAVTLARRPAVRGSRRLVGRSARSASRIPGRLSRALRIRSSTRPLALGVTAGRGSLWGHFVQLQMPSLRLLGTEAPPCHGRDRDIVATRADAVEPTRLCSRQGGLLASRTPECRPGISTGCPTD
jgi:hypothetical protein